MAPILEQLCGLDVTSTQVSRVAQKLDEELQQWRDRPLGKMEYAFLDARYEKVRVGGTVVSCALLVALGITPEGHRTILGLSVALSEAEVHWRDFLASLQARGLHGLKMITSDDHAGLKAALQSRFTGVPWQRCQFHLGQNLLDHIPKGISQSEVSGRAPPRSGGRRGVFNAPNKREAERQLELMVQKYAPWIPSYPPGWKTTCRKDSRFSPCLPRTGGGCEPTTAWNVSTAN